MNTQCTRCGNVALPNHKCLRPVRPNEGCERPACRGYGRTCMFPDRCAR